MKKSVSEADDTTSARSGASRGRALPLTIILALVLLLIGLLGAKALMLLDHAMRPPTADDLGALVCTAYKTQNYSLLTQQIISESTSASSTLQNKLRSLDSSEGHVTSCGYHSQPITATTKQYIFVMQRPHVSQSISLPMTFAEQSDGTWKIDGQGSIFYISAA